MSDRKEKVVEDSHTLKDRLQNFLSPPNIKMVEEKLAILDTKFKHVASESQHWKKKYENIIFKNGSNKYRKDMIMGSIFQKTINTKGQLIREVDKVKDNYLYNAILSLLVDDSLSPSATNPDVVTLTSKNKTIDAKLKQLQTNIDMDGLLNLFLEDTLNYGEYVMKPIVKAGKGIIDIEDSVDQSKIVAIYKGNPPVPEKYLKIGKKSIGRFEVKTASKNDYIHFVLGSRKLRIEIDNKRTKEYVRIGRPTFYGTFNLIANLELMGALIPASQIQKLNNTSIMGINVAEGTDPQQAFEITRRYEDMLNAALTVDTTTGTINVADVINQVSKFKCIPLYGNDRGSIQKVDPRYEDMDDVATLEDNRKSICGTIGVPYSFIYGHQGETKGESLKTFARYIRKLASIQTMVANGYKQIALIHCAQFGLSPRWEDIEVKFNNAMINIEELDKIEFIDTLVSTIGNIVETLNNISESSGAPIKAKVLDPFLKKFLAMVNLEGVINIKKDLNAPEEEPAAEPEPTPEPEPKEEPEKDIKPTGEE